MAAKGRTTTEAIRREALRLFAARGFAAVSMREIADAVGIRPGGLYNHFATKQDILLALMRGHMEELLEAWDAADPKGSPSAERLAAFARHHIRFHFRKPDDVFVAYMELRNLEPGNFQVLEALRGRYEASLRLIIEDGRFAVADAAVATRAIIAMLTGVTTWYRPGGRLSIRDIEDIYVGMALRSLGLEAPPATYGRMEPCTTAASASA